ncbi:MAG: hypothetical protein Q9200_003877, partial [Gallowayella weberi]
MARKPQCQPPLVSVIHHDVGEDRSISIDVFLRSIKRVPSKGFSDRRILKRQRISPPSKSQLDIPNTSSDTQLLLADEIPEHQPPSEQNHDIVIAPQGLGDLEHVVLQQRSGYTAECSGISNGRIHGDGSGDLDQTTSSAQGRLPKAIVTYSKQKNRSPYQPVIEEPPPKKPGKSPRRSVPVNELVLVDNTETPIIPCISKPNKPNEQRRPARKPLNEIRHNVRLSQRRSIDPKEFKFPPRTPANVKPVTWRLGSGFKRLPRLQQKMLSPVRNKKTRSGINRSARQIQVTRNASSIPQIRAQGVPITAAIEDIEDARDPEPPTSMVSPNAR